MRRPPKILLFVNSLAQVLSRKFQSILKHFWEITSSPLEKASSYRKSFEVLVLCVIALGLPQLLFVPVGVWDVTGIVFLLLWFVHIMALCVALLFAVYVMFAMFVEVGKRGLFYLSLSLLFIVPLFASALLPIISRDALIYHLAVPKFWLLKQKIVELPWHEWSHFPMSMGLGYLGFLRVGLEGATPFYHLSFFILSAVLLAVFCRYYFVNAELGLFAFVFLISVPLCFRFSYEPMSDFGLALFLVAAIFVSLVQAEEKSGSKIWQIGALLALAMGTKYNAFLLCGIFVVLYPFYLKTSNWLIRDAIITASFIGLISLCGAAPWLIKNYSWTGNPFFPFLGSVFAPNGGTPFVGEISPLEFRRQAHGESFFDLLLIPVRMLFNGADDSPSKFDGVLTPVLIFAVVPACLSFTRKIKKDWIVFLSLYSFICFALSIKLFHALSRYQIPQIYLAIFLIAFLCQWIEEQFGQRRSKQVLVFCLLVQSVFGFNYVRAISVEQDLIRYVSGDYSKDNYLKKHLSEYSLASYANQRIPKDAKMYLLLTGNRYYYYDREVRGEYFSERPLVQILKQSSKPLSKEESEVEYKANKLAEWMEFNGYDYLAIHNLRASKIFLDLEMLTLQEQEAWSLFVKKHLIMQWHDKIYSVWKFDKNK
jgi:hypothetical protein